MVGCIRYIRQKGRGRVSLAYVGTLTVMNAELYEPEGLPERRLLRRLYKLERVLSRQGIGRVVLSEGFPYRDLLRVLRPVETLPFYRGVADMLVLGWLNNRGVPAEMSRVGLAAPWLCPELKGAAERLCSQVRELVIYVPEEGEDYAQWLHSRYGLPVTPYSAQVHITAAFGPVEGVPGEILPLYGERPDLKGLSISAPKLQLPEDCAQQLLALMWEAGALERTGLEVTISPQALANKESMCYNN